MKSLTLLSTAAFAASIALVAPSAIYAAGSNDETPPVIVKCEEGWVFDKETGKCLEAESFLIDDDERYETLREYAYAGDYVDADIVLASFTSQDDPRVLNYKGFINRKLGNFDAAMEYYQAALKINPDYILARSYMGQGLAAQGNFAAARDQLAEIRTRGGRNTWAYASLSLALRGVQSDY